MAVQRVRHIAPFINDVFTITSPWWTERWGRIHRGLDITTGGNDPVYSMLDGIVHSKGYDADELGNWIIIKDNNVNSTTYGYATLYMHLHNSASVNVGDPVTKGMQIGIEGTTGHSTGIHLHVEMQDLNRWNDTWHWSYVKSDYLDPTQYMGIDNIDETSWIYDGTPVPPTPTTKDKSSINILMMKKVEMNRLKSRDFNTM